VLADRFLGRVHPRRAHHGRRAGGEQMPPGAPGSREGSTENAEVCPRLVADLAGRGLAASHGVLLSSTPACASDKAVRAVFARLVR
jgi:hypothetical protein